MAEKKKIHPTIKSKLHPRNKNRERYNFGQLIAVCPELKSFVKLNPYGDESIDFGNPKAVKILNKAILSANYSLNYWDIPDNYLCPPIPGRADYIHHAADLLANSHGGQLPTGSAINCLDIGVGANCIYPIIGTMEYGWSFVGADIDPIAIESANKIVNQNSILSGKIKLRQQNKATNIFEGIIEANEKFDLTICNPPFHASAAEAQAGTQRKNRNLKQKAAMKPSLNFGGQSNELWCDGGEEMFLQRMIHQSKQFEKSCLWFTSLVSKSERLPRIYQTLKQVEAIDIKTINMGQGNKISRIVAWTFLSKKEQQTWVKGWK
ncbi:23S rRNA (adenine(1618)-N(6))-methyltransferase RlmF [Mangrovibacterium lignilyticum]|uniref:23S rRNA (adenine(1618)-N(6))-methyltransferase RlmF n=1 Tax=Mangrovibacterium lignilyticum TaxID=2668052 RepID=UPI0013D71F66|nr:23S rRNA (adenine(1618)-N(6))-methyltransferase RlmF [Mangrovibacterium lignilyticum]